MKTPPTANPRRTIQVASDLGALKKNSWISDYGEEGVWLMGEMEGVLMPVSEITAELFAQAHRDWIEKSNLRLYGQRRY